MKFRQQFLRIGKKYRAIYDRPKSRGGNESLWGEYDVQITRIKKSYLGTEYSWRCKILSNPSIAHTLGFKDSNFLKEI